MEFLSEYGLFLLKTITLVLSILIVAGGIFGMSRKSTKSKDKLEITSLNKHRDTLKKQMILEVKGKKAAKKIAENKKQTDNAKPSLFVLEFQGDIKASQVESLREEVSAVLSVCTPQDEVMIKIESPGGSVNGYGLAAAQLQRIRDQGVPLTACIDKVAASGGYLMACVAHHIIASPFAIIGSIGVVAQIPNFHRWLKKNDVDVELMTAGDYKRTLTIFGENTEKGRQKFQEDIEKIHIAFRDYVLTNRHALTPEDMDVIATGEHWLAKDAALLKMVDVLKTSDDWLIEKMAHFNVFKVCVPAKQSLAQRLLKPAMKLLHPWA